MFGNSNDNSTFPFQINGEVINLKEKVFESGKRLSEIMVPVMAQLHFENFEESIKKGEYEKVYNSGVYKVIADLCDGTNFITVKPNTKVLRARAVKEINDLYRSEKGIHIENDVLRGYDWYNSKEPPIGISSEGRPMLSTHHISTVQQMAPQRPVKLKQTLEITYPLHPLLLNES